MRDCPLSVMPNAGYPVVARAQVRYQGKPEYFARELSGLAAEGVSAFWAAAAARHRSTLLPCALRWMLCRKRGPPPRRQSFPRRDGKACSGKRTMFFCASCAPGERVIAVELDSPKRC